MMTPKELQGFNALEYKSRFTQDEIDFLQKLFKKYINKFSIIDWNCNRCVKEVIHLLRGVNLNNSDGGKSSLV